MMFHVTVYHNAADQFISFRHERQLLAAFAFSRALPQNTTAEQLAEWTFCLLNIDPDTLVDSCPTLDTASAFELACRYRRQELRSLSVGDVVRVSTATAVCWLVCDGLGWSAIAAPSNVHAVADGEISTTCDSD
ncbi:hypothetical protein [Actinoplanes rectilineatus]|uniref:hypothetical protein n=1 Tax=Actinoplanes rectilineatus TaxID=113571 RepID=UPI0005F2D531|nr:hypothetical protein [Actinoplanes rectilineatus]